MRDLSRLLRPRSIALFGGDWAGNVARQLLKSGYDGAIWPVHPARAELCGLPCVPSAADLPAPPDAAFVGVNRAAAVEVIADLAAMGAGGATCFASGFAESAAEDAAGAGLQAALVARAGAMPVLGPNCYGLLNYLDNVTLWPDQHGGLPVARGVAIIAQSSNVAINMTMQARGLPIAYVVTAGNQAQTGVAAIGAALLDDPRVSALGLYLEGFGDLRALEALAARARAAGKPVVVLKTGRSDRARAAGMTHTASLAGAAEAASALIARLGLVEVRGFAAFLETLKLLDALGPLPGAAVASVSCSGGEASLMADAALATAIDWRPLSPPARDRLRAVLGPLVGLANPLDYHTFIWGDAEAMTRVLAAVMGDGFDLTVLVLDLPRADRCDPSSYDCALRAVIAARAQTGARVAVLASLPENLPEPVAARLAEHGIATLHGLDDGIAAIDAAIAAGRASAQPAAAPLVLAPPLPGPVVTLDEAAAKAALAADGVPVPRGVRVAETAGLAAAVAVAGLRPPLALKGLGVAHKTEAGAVRLGLTAEALAGAAAAMPAPSAGWLVEEMATGGVAELLVGVTRDPAGVLMLTMGAGGVLAEIMADTAHLLLPTTPEAVAAALARLRIAPLLAGFRGRPAADMGALVAAILAIARHAEAQADRLAELDVNPLIARPQDAVAVDALIRLHEPEARHG